MSRRVYVIIATVIRAYGIISGDYIVSMTTKRGGCKRTTRNQNTSHQARLTADPHPRVGA